MGANNHYTAQQFIDAIPGSGGIIGTIARRIPCAWHTAKKYINSYATVKAAYDDEVATVADIAESIVLLNLQIARRQQSEDGKRVDATDAKWYLTMKGSDRGYVPKEARQIEGDVTIRVVWDDD